MILGLGNPVLGDDAAGLRVAAAVEELLRERPVGGVTVATSTRGGFDVVELLAGSHRAVIIDHLVALDPEPGRIRRLALEDCAGSPRLTGAHDMTLAHAFALARSTGIDMPAEVEIYGIESADDPRLAEGLSPAVEDAVKKLAARIYTELIDALTEPSLPAPRGMGGEAKSVAAAGL